MKKLSKKILSLVLLMIVLCTSCRSVSIEHTENTLDESSSNTNLKETTTGEPSSEDALEEQAAFDKYTDDLFIDILSESSLSVHSYLSYPEKLGISDAPYTLGDASEETFNEDNETLKTYLDDLKEFDYDLLTTDQKLTYDILYTDLEESIELNDYYWFNSYLSPLTGIPSSLPSYFGEFELNSEQDVIDYLELIKLVPEYYDSIMEFETSKAEKGMGIPDFQIDEVIDLCNEFIGNVDEHFLIKSFDSRLGDIESVSDADKKKYSEENIDIVKNTIIPAYQKLISQLSSLKGKGKNDGGLCNFDDGDKYYELLVRSLTGSEKSVTEIKEMLNNKLEEDISSVITLSYKDSTLYDKMGEYSFDTSDPDTILQYLLDAIKDDFPDGFNTNYTVNEVPQDIEKYESPAYYYIPHIDNTSRNNIYINRYSDYEDMDLYPVLAHEGFPGHMYQTTYFQNTNPSNIRSLLRYDGYIEGWGLYAELYSYQLAGQSSNLTTFNQAINCLSYDIYCISDIGINYEGWSREDTADFITSCGFDKSISDEIYNTLVENPGVYLAYYVGYLEFMEMRDEAMETLGDNFNIKNFHKFILDIGPSQFEILKDRFETWLEAQATIA
jgi:uncharacterized protein (DUF885 family)